METEPRNQCNECKDKPCIDNPYNSDQDCWFHPGQELLIPALIEIAKTVKEEEEE